MQLTGSVVQSGRSSLGQLYEVDPQQIPNVLTSVCTVTCRINELQIVNSGASAAVIYVGDLQITPGVLIPNILLPVGGMISLSNSLRKMKNGIAWSASQPGVTGWLMLIETLPSPY